MKKSQITGWYYTILTGIMNFVMIAFLALFIEFLKWSPIVSFPIAFMLMACGNYYFVRKKLLGRLKGLIDVIKYKSRIFRQYMIVALGSMLVNQIVMVLLTYEYGLEYSSIYPVFIAGIFCHLWSKTFNERYTFVFSFKKGPYTQMKFAISFMVVLIGAIMVSMQYY